MINLIKIPGAQAHRNKNNKQNYTMLLFGDFAHQPHIMILLIYLLILTDSQGMYNLVALAQQGHVLPPSILGSFNVTHDDEVDIVVEKILRRCHALIHKPIQGC